MFKKKDRIPEIEFHKESQKPVVKCSICTGEQVAGFKDLKTGKFTEVMLIQSDADLDEFCGKYGLDRVEKEY